MAARERDEDSGRGVTRAPVRYATLAPLQAGAVAPVKIPEKVKAFSYQSPAFKGSKSPGYNIPNAPAFNVGPYLLPRGEDVFNDPSYQFRLNEGLKALERSAAAKGMLRTGNTLEELMRYGSDYASQEYGKAAERKLGQYQQNLAASQAMYQPQYATWQARAEAEARQKDAAYQRQFDLYKFQLEDQFAREKMLLDAQRGL